MAWLTKRKGEALAILAYGALATFLWSIHEPWRDEAQAWLIARDVESPLQLFGLMGYEGSPALWHLLIMPLARLGLPFWSIGVLHLLIILAAVVVLHLRAPFPLWQRVLITGGYFFAYEYSALARNYAVSVLLLFLIATLHADRFRKPFLYAGLLFLLANANVHSLVAAFALSAAFAYELLLERRGGVAVGRALGALAFVGAGGLLAVLQLRPPPDLAFWLSRWNTDMGAHHLSEIPSYLTDALMPIPQDQQYFWFFNRVAPVMTGYINQGHAWAALLVGLLVIAAYFATVALLLPDRKLTLVYLGATVGLIAIFFYRYAGSARHHGLIYILFLTLLWMHRAERGRAPAEATPAATPPPPARARWRTVWRQGVPRTWATAIFTTLLVLHALGTPVAAKQEWIHEFSSARSSATWLLENDLAGEENLIATYPSAFSTSLLPYLQDERKTFYMLEYETNMSYMVWNSTLARGCDPISGCILTPEQIQQRVDLAPGTYPRVLLILRWDLNNTAFRENFTLLASFTDHVAPDEVHHIYERRARTP